MEVPVPAPLLLCLRPRLRPRHQMLQVRRKKFCFKKKVIFRKFFIFKRCMNKTSLCKRIWMYKTIFYLGPLLLENTKIWCSKLDNIESVCFLSQTRFWWFVRLTSWNPRMGRTVSSITQTLTSVTSWSSAEDRPSRCGSSSPDPSVRHQTSCSCSWS